MTENGTGPAHDQITLRSRLSEMAELPKWIEALAARHSIPDQTQYAINLCLEEAVSNVIRHGYAGVPDGSVIVHFTKLAGAHYEFVVEDKAPHFNPLEAAIPTPVNEQGEMRVGGRGILLLLQFANTLAYEATPTGNRLRMGF